MAREELLWSFSIRDCNVQYYTAGGPGGSGKDTSNTACRITHPASGAVASSQEHRSQRQNRIAAFRRLAAHPKWKAWHKLETARRLSGGGSSVSGGPVTDYSMRPENLRVEAKQDGRWVSLPPG